MRNPFIFIPVIVVFILLTLAIALNKGKGLRVIYRESGDKIFNWAMAIARFGLAFIFAILMIINNGLSGTSRLATYGFCLTIVWSRL